MTRKDLVEALIDAAKQHGEDSAPDLEVGDLQDCLLAALSLLSENQFEVFYNTDAVIDTLEAGGKS